MLVPADLAVNGRHDFGVAEIDVGGFEVRLRGQYCAFCLLVARQRHIACGDRARLLF
jgi:hypothetical protein